VSSYRVRTVRTGWHRGCARPGLSLRARASVSRDIRFTTAWDELRSAPTDNSAHARSHRALRKRSSGRSPRAGSLLNGRPPLVGDTKAHQPEAPTDEAAKPSGLDREGLLLLPSQPTYPMGPGTPSPAATSARANGAGSVGAAKAAPGRKGQALAVTLTLQRGTLASRGARARLPTELERQTVGGAYSAANGV
jgi:hypothetical protein